jgi:hypothetical protein
VVGARPGNQGSPRSGPVPSRVARTTPRLTDRSRTLASLCGLDDCGLDDPIARSAGVVGGDVRGSEPVERRRRQREGPLPRRGPSSVTPTPAVAVATPSAWPAPIGTRGRVPGRAAVLAGETWPSLLLPTGTRPATGGDRRPGVTHVDVRCIPSGRLPTRLSSQLSGCEAHHRGDRPIVSHWARVWASRSEQPAAPCTSPSRRPSAGRAARPRISSLELRSFTAIQRRGRLRMEASGSPDVRRGSTPADSSEPSTRSGAC